MLPKYPSENNINKQFDDKKKKPNNSFVVISNVFKMFTNEYIIDESCGDKNWEHLNICRIEFNIKSR